MGTDLIILGLRALFVLLIYAFLAQVVLVIVRDLKRASSRNVSSERESAYLVVIDCERSDLCSEGPIPGQRFSLGPITSLGRAPSNTVCLADTFASAEHALLALRDGQWWIEDLNSTNGTALNQRPVDRPMRLKSGDIIEIGRTRMKMVKEGGNRD